MKGRLFTSGLLALGIVLGPHGLRVLSEPVLAFVAPAVTLALAVLGALVGLGLRLRRPHVPILPSFFQPAFTLVVVASGVALSWPLWDTQSLPEFPWIVPLLLAACALPSRTVVNRSLPDSTGISDGSITLDDLLAVVASGVALVALHPREPASVMLAAQAAGVTAAMALGGSALAVRTDSDSEQRTIVIGTLLLVSGAAAYLSMSPLVAGLTAGVLWNASGGVARERFSRDAGYLRHPLVAILLITAGAHVSFSSVVAALTLLYVAFRTIAKLAGGLAARRFAAAGVELRGAWLVSPGVIAIGVAVAVLQSTSAEPVETVLSVIVLGSIVSDVVALSLPLETAP